MIWVQLKDYPKYAVCREGYIKNIETGCVLAGSISKAGYKEVSVVIIPGKAVCENLHTLIAVTFLGERPEGYVVDHKDRNRSNCALTNLQYILKEVNDAQGSDKRRGELHMCSKLDNEQVRKIKWAGALGISSRELARKFKVDRSMISYIISGKSWSHI